jgi:hypothetical protein
MPKPFVLPDSQGNEKDEGKKHIFMLIIFLL